MGWTIGIPSMKLSTTNNKSKHCGNFYLVAAEALKERIGRDADIDPSLSYKNIYCGFDTAKDLLAYSKAHCDTLTDAKGRALRSDAVKMCVTLVKPPAAFMDTLSEEQQVQFLHDATDKIKEIVTESNIKSIAMHFDELGPHAHVFWEPMTEDGRLCAKEMHNLKYLGRLNKELPSYLRECGWDIDDCNVYDQAVANLESEKSKAERHNKNGRSSAVYKAEAELKLNIINQQLNSSMYQLEEQLVKITNQSIENVVNTNSGIYDNVLFLISECDDERFAELDEEGRRLKESVMKELVKDNSVIDSLDETIKNINRQKANQISWETRQKMWETYRIVSNEFWCVRNEMKQNYNDAIELAYIRRRIATNYFYEAVDFSYRSRTWLSLFISLLWLCAAKIQEDIGTAKINRLKEERQKLFASTTSFSRFCNTYRAELKANKPPLERYIASMEQIVKVLDDEAEKFLENKKFQKDRLRRESLHYKAYGPY